MVMPTSLKVITATALIGIGTLSLSPPANAGWGCGWGPALAGFGVGALVGSALAAPPVYVVPPPPSVNVTEDPAQTFKGPLIAEGKGFTVSIAVAKHPVPGIV